MFTQRLNELKLRQLELQLRNLELRGELRAEARAVSRPASWLGLLGSAAGAAVLLGGLRKSGRLLRFVGLAQLGLRLARLWRGFFSA